MPHKALFSPKLLALLLPCLQKGSGKKDKGRLTTGLKGYPRMQWPHVPRVHLSILQNNVQTYFNCRMQDSHSIQDPTSNLTLQVHHLTLSQNFYGELSELTSQGPYPVTAYSLFI